MTRNRRRSARLDLERLEDRQLLSAGSITDHGGFVQHFGSIDVVFYGPAWGSGAQNLEPSLQSGLHGVIDPSSSGPNSYLATLKNARYGDFSLSFADSTNTSADGKLKPHPVLHTASHLPVGATTPVATLAAGGTTTKMRAGVIDMIFADGAFEGTIDEPQTGLGATVRRAV